MVLFIVNFGIENELQLICIFLLLLLPGSLTSFVIVLVWYTSSTSLVEKSNLTLGLHVLVAAIVVLVANSPPNFQGDIQEIEHGNQEKA